jgi:hypothetical protein
MTIRQLVAAEFGVTPTRVSQYVRAGMPLDNAANAMRWVRRNFRVRSWGEIINVPTSIVHTTPPENIRFVR